MKISYNWLKQYVNLPDSVSPIEVAEKLKLATVEVEGVASLGEHLENVVVGKVVSAEKHPQADKLKLCSVDVGNEKLQIVCGGSNVREGMLVALAKVGAKVKWHGEGDLVELKPTAIRGIESFGMICGATEIGLAEMFPPADDHEIVDLTEAVPGKEVGKPLAAALGLNETVFEIDNKSLSNRPDLWGHYGLAREVATLFGKNLKEYKTKGIKAPKKAGWSLAVEVKDSVACPRYMAVAISGIKVAPSPDWLKQRLTAAGFRPINNIVDITNYIMMDIGEPMHAFNANHLSQTSEQTAKILVRQAEKDEVLALLDGNKIELTSDDLVIADGVKPLALAGIMGGEYSGINDATETIIFEAANFNPGAIRRSSIRHGLRTDSSARFEKSLDPNLCAQALERAVELTLEVCPNAKVVSAPVDVGKFIVPTGPIILEKNFIEKKLGAAVPEKQVAKILEHLGFDLKDKGDNWSVTIPTWRATKDVSIAEDLVEEVVRIYGYESVSASLPSCPITPPPVNILRVWEHRMRDVLAHDLSFSEVENYSFVSHEQVEKMRDRAEYLVLDNPLTKEKPLLRRSLVPNLLENVVKNIEYFNRVAIFEIGKIFLGDQQGARATLNGSELLPRQDVWLTAVCAEKKNDSPFFEARRALENISSAYNLPFAIVKNSKPAPWCHPARTAEVRLGEQAVGAIYEINPLVTRNFGLSARVAVLEINLSLLSGWNNIENVKYERPPSFPEVERDLAFVVDVSIEHEMIASVLKNIDSLVKKVALFDMFQGESIGVNKKSLAYRLVLSHPERTLNTAEVDGVMEKVKEMLAKKFGAEVRK